MPGRGRQPGADAEGSHPHRRQGPERVLPLSVSDCIGLSTKPPRVQYAICGNNPVIGKPTFQTGVTWTKCRNGGTPSQGGFWDYERNWVKRFGLSQNKSKVEDKSRYTKTSATWTFTRTKDGDRFKNLHVVVAPR